MVTVGVDPVQVEEQLRSGLLTCPGCSGRLTRWGSARPRVVRGLGGVVIPRRARCSGCGGTHVLLPVSVLARRADAVVVIGAALAAKALGLGVRSVAALVDRPFATVRGWLRVFAARAEAVRVRFTTLLCDLDADPPVLPPAGSLFADALVAVAAAAEAVARRWPAVGVLSPWHAAAAVTGGLLLAPAGLGVLTNTSCPVRWPG